GLRSPARRGRSLRRPPGAGRREDHPPRIRIADPWLRRLARHGAGRGARDGRQGGGPAARTGATRKMNMGDDSQITAEQRERSGRREQNKAENRTALLKAARAVFAEMSYSAASVRGIVRRTDLASGPF